MRALFFVLLFMFVPFSALCDDNLKTNNNYNFGLALGGGNNTFTNPLYSSGLHEINPRAVRLESVTGDYRKLYNPITKTWDFTRIDKEVDNMKASNPFIIANIFYFPKFISSCETSNKYPYCPPKDYKLWDNYLTTLALHLSKKYNIKYWEIGNEPTNNNFFKGGIGAFIPFYIHTSKLLKSIDSDFKVGGMADNPKYLNNYEDFLNGLKKENKLRSLLDFVSIHWYAQWGDGLNPQEIYYQYTQTNSLLEHYGLKSTPIFLTEWNVIAEGNLINAQQVTASYYLSSLYWLVKARIEKNLFFRVQPYGSASTSLYSKSYIKNKIFDIYRFVSLNSANLELSKKGEVYTTFSPQGNGYITYYPNNLNTENTHEFKICLVDGGVSILLDNLSSKSKVTNNSCFESVIYPYGIFYFDFRTHSLKKI